MIGVGVVTYDREKQFFDILKSISKVEVDHIVCVKDGGKAAYSRKPNHDFFELRENKGVGFCKNLCIERLLEDGCDHIFILEDDAFVKDNSVWKYCIEFAEETGLLHFNWNNYRSEDRMHIPAAFPNFKALISYNTEANFSYFHRKYLENIRFDVNFVNAWEHVDVEYQGVMQGFLPAFRMFVSPMELGTYLKVVDEGKSTIAGKPLHQERIYAGHKHWIEKWGVDIKDLHPIPMEQFVEKMKEITKKYGQSNKD